jgi:hypothetical protein
MLPRSPFPGFLAIFLVLTILVDGCASAPSPTRSPTAVANTTSRQLQFPSFKGIDYAVPRAQNGLYVGTEWLGVKGTRASWAEVRPSIVADANFMRQNHLGNVLRISIGLDQLVQWNDQMQYVGLDELGLQHFADALSIFAENDIKIIGILFLQEDPDSAGNFRFQALDGNHPNMRSGYLKAEADFLRRFGGNPTIVAWDIFNEAYNVLTLDGGITEATARAKHLPTYSDQVVYTWLQDLYHTAKKAAPDAWFTVSDATDLYRARPNLSKYAGVVDYYDIHVYDDHPHIGNWKTQFDKPFIIGEAGASQFRNQAANAPAVQTILDEAWQAGAKAVLLHSIEDHNLFPASRIGLTASGNILAAFPH